MILRLILIALLAFCLNVTPVHAETPTEAVEHYFHWCMTANPPDQKMREHARQIAREHGVAVIPAIMENSKKWESEEVLLYIYMVYCLPADKTVPILEEYKKNGKPSEKSAATDLLTEIQETIPHELKEMSPTERKKFEDLWAP